MTYLLYVIEFPNKKRYFGITSKTMRERWKRHCGEARRGSMLPVHQAIMHFGADRLVPEVLVYGDKIDILHLEIEFIKFFCTTDRSLGYNLGLGGETSPMLSADVVAKHVGKRHSAITLNKMSKPHIMTPEGRVKLRNLRLGIVVSEVTVDKIRAARSRQKISEESNLKRSIALTGIVRSEETRRKMSEARKAVCARRRVERDTKNAAEAGFVSEGGVG